MEAVAASPALDETSDAHLDQLEAAGLDARAARMDPDAPTPPELLRGAGDDDDAAVTLTVENGASD